MLYERVLKRRSSREEGAAVRQVAISPAQQPYPLYRNESEVIRDECDRFSDQSELCSCRFQRCIDESKSLNHEGSVFIHDRPKFRRARHSYSRRNRPCNRHGEQFNDRKIELEVLESQDATALSACPPVTGTGASAARAWRQAGVASKSPPRRLQTPPRRF